MKSINMIIHKCIAPLLILSSPRFAVGGFVSPAILLSPPPEYAARGTAGGGAPPPPPPSSSSSHRRRRPSHFVAPAETFSSSSSSSSSSPSSAAAAASEEEEGGSASAAGAVDWTRVTNEWELDCYSRPVLVEDGKKKLWEVLVTDSSGTMRVCRSLPSNK